MSATLEIKVDYDNSQFTPGETISGTVMWAAPAGTEGIALRLFWFTRGRGTQEIELVDERTWPVSPSASSQGNEKFAFVLPAEPYSFSGRLITLIWALEAVALPSETSKRFEFTLSPNGREIELTPVGNPASEDKKKKWLANNR